VSLDSEIVRVYGGIAGLLMVGAGMFLLRVPGARLTTARLKVSLALGLLAGLLMSAALLRWVQPTEPVQVNREPAHRSNLNPYILAMPPNPMIEWGVAAIVPTNRNLS
jgi:hypothetical protein